MNKKKKITNFEKLTPFTDSDIGFYEDAINYVFENNNLRNIAVSGPYGAGKSSVLESYKKKNKRKKFIHISLPHFEDNSNENCIQESLIEMKILNQLIYQIPIRKIPQTKFPLKKRTTILEIIILASLLVFYSSMYWYLSYSDDFWSFGTDFFAKLKVIELKGILEFFRLSLINLEKNILDSRILIDFVLIALTGVITFVVVAKIIILHKNKGIFKRLNYKGAEIEFDYKKTESFFDTYLNEVIYLFENSGADAIVFEDIDRFSKIKVFERLREINNLVNNKLQLKRKIGYSNSIKFFYLLRDDIFDSKDRVKFFDFIIPIVPIISNHNSYQLLHNNLNGNNNIDIVSRSFLRQIAFYIDDMRLLKNICNEFLIYLNKLNNKELDNDKLFAMIIYKNLFPEDYVNTQLNRGYVSDILEQKIEERINKEITVRGKNDKISFKGGQRDLDRVKGNVYYNAIEFLIDNGYIDDDYPKYMTYTYDDEFSFSDRLFIQKVLTKEENKIEKYEIENQILINSESVYKMLGAKFIIEHNIKNVSLMLFLFENYYEYEHVILELIRKLDLKEDLEFIANSLKKIGNLNNYVLMIYEQFKDEWALIYRKQVFGERNNLIIYIGFYFRAFLEKERIKESNLEYIEQLLNNADLSKAKIEGADLSWINMENSL